MESIFGSKICGTYVKAIQYHSSFPRDAYLILYLLKSGHYLFIGSWRGYELTVAAGRWIESQDQVELDGIGRFIFMDSMPFSTSFRSHKRTFSIKMDSSTPTLQASSEQEEWSLLGWSGSLNYLGKLYFFALEDEDLPARWQDIEPWVQEFLADHESIN